MLEAVFAPIIFGVIVLVLLGFAVFRYVARGRAGTRREARQQEASARRARGEISHDEYQRRRRSG
jgi:uncharacterized membrane protein